MPLRETGEVDENALTQLPVVDEGLLRRWDEPLHALPGIRLAVVVAQEQDPGSCALASFRCAGHPVTSHMNSYRKAADFADPEALVPQVLPWVLAAGNPYYGWLFGRAELAARTLEKWMKRASSEVSILRVQLLMCDSDFAGGFIALNGLDLRGARMADADALWTGVDSSGREALIQQMAKGADLFPPVAEDEYYLSKMGLNTSYRGRGFGRALVRRYLDEGEARGHIRYRLDVQADNERAMRCYVDCGFKVFNTTQSVDGTLKYYSMRYER